MMSGVARAWIALDDAKTDKMRSIFVHILAVFRLGSMHVDWAAEPESAIRLACNINVSHKRNDRHRLVS